MSYDIDLIPPVAQCDTCKRSYDRVSGPNPTYNLAGIFDLALTGEPLPNPDVSEGAVVLLNAKTARPRGLRLLNKRLANATLAQIDSALLRLKSPSLKAEFRALEPKNGWGTIADAIEVLGMLRELAQEYPDHTWAIQ